MAIRQLGLRGLDAYRLYEQLYCAREDMENRIKEQQLALFADRTNTATMRANQLRLYFSGLAYCLLQALRHLALAGTALARAQCESIRRKLLKVGRQVRLTVRRVWVSFSQSYTHQAIFAQVLRHIRIAPLPEG